MHVKAIETEYAGVRFRSRTEARWALFFDAMGVRWDYEREGFDLPSGRYLPDFWIQVADQWVEVKGQAPTESEGRLCAELAEVTGKRVVLVIGSPTDLPDAWEYQSDDDSGIAYFGLTPDGLEMTDTYYWPCVCPKCGRFGFQFNGRGQRVCREACGFGPNQDGAYTYDDPRILAAIDRVRRHRFWNPNRGGSR